MAPSAPTAGGRRARRWTRDTIIAKILEWDARYGEPPCSADWNPSLARWRAQDWRAERYRDGIWPSTNAAKRPFGGSFSAAVRAAGLEPHRPGPRRRAPGVARPAITPRGPLPPRDVTDELARAADHVELAETRIAALARPRHRVGRAKLGRALRAPGVAGVASGGLGLVQRRAGAGVGVGDDLFDALRHDGPHLALRHLHAVAGAPSWPAPGPVRPGRPPTRPRRAPRRASAACASSPRSCAASRGG